MHSNVSAVPTESQQQLAAYQHVAMRCENASIWLAHKASQVELLMKPDRILGVICLHSEKACN